MLLVVLSKRIPWQRKHLSVAQCSDIQTGLDRIVHPLPASLFSIANDSMRHCQSSILTPGHTSTVPFRLAIGSDKRIEQDVHWQCLSGIRVTRAEEVFGQVVDVELDETGVVLELVVQYAIWMGSIGVVGWYIAMEYV
jgi:hypothetical protein